MDTTDTIIVGAGIIGSMLAYWLGKSGRSVRLLERNLPGQEASGSRAGLLTTIAEGNGSGAYLDLSRQGLQTLLETVHEVEQETGLDVGLVGMPLFRIANSAEEREVLHRFWQSQRDQGGKAEWLDQEALRAAIPGISTRVVGAIGSLKEYHLVPSQLLQALLTAAQQRYRVKLQTGVQVQRLLVKGQRVVAVEAGGQVYQADQIVLASGAWTPFLLRPLGLHLKVAPQKGQMLGLSPRKGSLSCMINTAWGYIVPKPDGSVVVGATQEDAGFDKEITPAGLAHLLRILSVLPSLMQSTLRYTFVGLRPRSEDGMPLLGTLANWDGIYIATGHSQHGFLLSDISARMLTAYLNGEEPGPLWPAFQVTRAVVPIDEKEP